MARTDRLGFLICLCIIIRFFFKEKRLEFIVRRDRVRPLGKHLYLLAPSSAFSAHHRLSTSHIPSSSLDLVTQSATTRIAIDTICFTPKLPHAILEDAKEQAPTTPSSRPRQSGSAPFCDRSAMLHPQSRYATPHGKPQSPRRSPCPPIMTPRQTPLGAIHIPQSEAQNQPRSLRPTSMDQSFW